MLKVLILVSSLHTGDMSQVEEISRAFSKNNIMIHKETIDAKEPFISAADKYYKLTQQIPKNEKYITLAVGEEPMKLLKLLSQNKMINTKRSYTCLFIHQYFSNIKHLQLDQLIIPQITINTKEEMEVVKKIPNVTYIFAPLSNNPSVEELKNSYDNWNDSNKPSLDGKYIIVMMPGDAPDSKNKIHFFTKESANKLFLDIAKLWQKLGRNHQIIIQNGPRTGKFDPTTGEIACKHEYLANQNPELAIDEVSKYFINLFKDQGINYSFFNFAVKVDGENRKTISYFNPLLYLAQQNNNIFVIPGGSVSMMGQIPLYLNSDRIILFKPSSMNEDHEAIFHLAFSNNYLSYFAEDGLIISPAKIEKRKNEDSAQVIKNLLNNYNKKH